DPRRGCAGGGCGAPPPRDSRASPRTSGRRRGRGGPRPRPWKPPRRAGRRPPRPAARGAGRRRRSGSCRCAPPRAGGAPRRGARAPPGRQGASREPPQTVQIGAPVLRLAGGPGLLVRTADRPVIAVLAGTAFGHGGKEAGRERASDDLDYLAREAPVLGVERHDALLVAAVGRAVVEPSRLDRLGEEALAGERVEERLQHRAAAHHDARPGTGLARLVVGGAEHAARVALDAGARPAH